MPPLPRKSGSPIRLNTTQAKGTPEQVGRIIGSNLASSTPPAPGTAAPTVSQAQPRPAYVFTPKPAPAPVAKPAPSQSEIYEDAYANTANAGAGAYRKPLPRNVIAPAAQGATSAPINYGPTAGSVKPTPEGTEPQDVTLPPATTRPSGQGQVTTAHDQRQRGDRMGTSILNEGGGNLRIDQNDSGATAGEQETRLRATDPNSVYMTKDARTAWEEDRKRSEAETLAPKREPIVYPENQPTSDVLSRESGISEQKRKRTTDNLDRMYQQLANMGTHSPGRAELEAQIEKEQGDYAARNNGARYTPQNVVEGQTTQLGEGGTGTSRQGLTASPGNNIGTSQQGLSSTDTSANKWGTHAKPVHVDPNTAVKNGDSEGPRDLTIGLIASKTGWSPDAVQAHIDAGGTFEHDGDELQVVTKDGEEFEDVSTSPDVQQMGNYYQTQIDQGRNTQGIAESETMSAEQFQQADSMLEKSIDWAAFDKQFDELQQKIQQSSARNKALTLKALQERNAQSGGSVNQMMGEQSQAAYGYDTEAQQQEAAARLAKESQKLAMEMDRDAKRFQLYKDRWSKTADGAERAKLAQSMAAIETEQYNRSMLQYKIQQEASKPGIGMTLAKIGIGIAGAAGAIFTGGTSLAGAAAVIGGLGTAASMAGSVASDYNRGGGGMPVMAPGSFVNTAPERDRQAPGAGTGTLSGG